MDYLFAPERLERPDFVLRSYREDDGPLLCEATRSSFDHLRPWMPWAVRDQTEEEAAEIVRRFRGRWLLSEDFVFGIFRPDEGELLGSSGFHLREGSLEPCGAQSGNAETGMWLRADRSGQGLGTAVLRAILDWGFDAWPWERIAWRCEARNVASRRVADKVGMRHEGLLRSHLLDVEGHRQDTHAYSALRAEWRAAADGPP